MKVFFIGICGISMSALAYIMKEDGNIVEGSDLNLENIPRCLNEIKLHKQPYLEGIEWADLIVYSSAVKDNEEIRLAKKLGKEVIPRGDLLGRISSQYEKVIAVAGSHGKTTTTAMIYHTLWINGKNPTLHLGGLLKDVGNVVDGEKEFFVTEACEYCDNFLYLRPYIAVVTNIEPEHLDYFHSFNSEKKSFLQFEKNSKIVVNKLNYQAKNIRINKEGKVSFSVIKCGEKIDRINLKIGGKYNSQNALYCLEVCEKLGLNFNQIKLGLGTFKGVRKRCEKVENNFDFDTYIDYAHHPKEIKESAKYFKKICKGKCVAVFQPHTYSRTKEFYNDFIKSLSIFDEVICYKTYPAREKPEQGYDEKILKNGLIKNGQKALICEEEKYLIKLLKKYKKNDIIIFLGAGDLPDKFNFHIDLT